MNCKYLHDLVNNGTAEPITWETHSHGLQSRPPIYYKRGAED